ncbi:MAG TPA: glycosyltransferase, partial [Longimicrobiales bacterium]|nr:glycosyltransferase [Longimicrobiales bacterium]
MAAQPPPAAHPAPRRGPPLHVALLLTSFRAGGAERVMLDLAGEFASRGLAVDLVIIDRDGPLGGALPPGIRTVDLGAGRVLRAAVPLVRYLRRSRPDVLLSTQSHANLLALAARRAGRVHTRVVLRETTTRFRRYTDAGWKRIRRRLMVAAIRRLYREGDALVGVSEGVTSNLVENLPALPGIVRTIYNPVVTSDMLARAREDPGHPWTSPGAPPLILAAGRLVEAKDYPTLLRAFAVVRTMRSANLLILGE